MYLSRVPLNLKRLDTIALVSSPYKVHAAIEGAFAPDAVREGAEGRILWRLDEAPGNEREVWLYVVSPEKPDFTHICDRVVSTASPTWMTKDYGPVLNQVSEGQLWQFRLKANPVRKVLVDKGRREREGVIGTLQGHVTEAQQREWLMDPALPRRRKDSSGWPCLIVVESGSRDRAAWLRLRLHNTMASLRLSTLIHLGTHSASAWAVPAASDAAL